MSSPDLSGVLRDARVSEIADFLQVSTQAARSSIEYQTTRWSSNAAILEQRQMRARCLRAALRSGNSLRTYFRRLAELEPTVRGFLAAPSELEEEGYSQLFFRSSGTAVLNHVPYLLGIWTMLKVTIFPFMSVVMPLLAIIGPYIIVRYMTKIPISFGRYLSIAKSTYFGGGGDGIPAATPWANMKGMMQIVLFCITTAQSIYQPIQSARHLRSIDTTVREKGAALEEFVATCELIRAEYARLGVKTPRLPIPRLNDSRRLVAFALESPELIGLLFEWVGAWDVATAIAEHPQCIPVTWITDPVAPTTVHIADTCDTRIAANKQKVFTVSLGNDNGLVKGHALGYGHALLTGPNRGGKSTVLRALLRSVVLAHTYGVAIGSECKMTPLDWVQSSLRMEDLPGSESFFEREVKFARHSLRRPGRGLVCIDELFHSTNPPDAETTSREYLKALWERERVVSIISTHIFDIVHTSPTNIARLCCPAVAAADGSIKYMYGLAPGICEVSSVREIIGDAFSGK